MGWGEWLGVSFMGGSTFSGGQAGLELQRGMTNREDADGHASVRGLSRTVSSGGRRA